MTQVASGWRGEIFLETIGGKKIATKKAKNSSVKGAIQKEISLLQYLEKHEIGFTPKILTSTDDSFSYERISGRHFEDVYKNSTNQAKRILVLQLLNKAYMLDGVGVVHGEMIRPTKNMLVNKNGEIFVIDFERGEFHDYSGKNMRSLAQWIFAQGYIDLQQCKSLGKMNKDEIYQNLSKRIHEGKKNIFIKNTTLLVTLLFADLGSKFLFFNKELLSNFRLLTPSFNTGIGWSIQVPLDFVSILTVVIVCFAGIALIAKKLPRIGTLMFIAGACGNLIDRLMLGGVRDFIDFHYWPIFNLADVRISIGVFLLVIYLRKE